MTDAEREGWIGLVSRIAGGLPPAFLSLLAINTAFLGLLFWFLNSQIEGRLVLVGKLIDACGEKMK